ncbi:hypothetical protein MKK69_07925 [Methylobacterium sp. J-026]|uniref:hypothetical protein n=1 Tax=Methylobacterium sp. J-026 TaxID=2836624 RepID=UPI001FB97739|nr:hypothetical protein [Methylobacterium sp. J-026]MCJ2133993.1 hypothetical protein [Methylobacterium sp. J-026]
MAERVTSVPLETGLYVLRYVQAPTAHGAPHVFVRPSPGSEDVVEVISPPGERPGSISAPGGCVVVRAERASSLHVTISSALASGGAEAELRLESLAGAARPGASVQGTAQPSVQPPTVAPPAPRLDVMGHVSRRGDVRVGDGRWVAGPESPAPIEGLEVGLLDRTSGLALEYQVQVGGPGGAWTPWMTGGFAGTRGQARALLGARLRLVGARASQFQIDAEALFLGATVMRLKGQAIEVISGSGVDPLVGLKLLVAAANPVPQRSADAPAASPQSAARAGRVRVFRSADLR